MDNNGADFLMGETFVDGQQRDVWCNSKVPIVDMNMHLGGSPQNSLVDTFIKPASCYKVSFSGSQSKLVLYGDSCLFSSNALNSYFLCE